MADSEPKTLIAFLTRPLKKPEDQQQAREQLDSFLKDEDLAGRKPGRQRWVYGLWLIAVVVLILDMRHAQFERRTLGVISMMDAQNHELPTLETESMTDHEKLVFAPKGPLSGNPKQQLHLNHPQHPGYFAQYVEEHLADTRRLPDKFMETAERIDPDNAYFPLLKAAEVIDNQIESEKIFPREHSEWVDGRRIRMRHPPRSYEVPDQQVLEEALALIRQACESSRLQTYYTERQLEVAQIMDRAGRNDTLPGLIRTVMLWIDAGISPLQFRRAQQVISARAYQAYMEKDKELLLEMIELREKLVQLLGRSEDKVLINALVYQAIAQSTADDFEYYCRELGMPELEEKYRQQGEALHAHRQQAGGGPNSEFMYMELHRRAGVLQGMMLPVVTSKAKDLPLLDDSYLQPLREAEHDFGTRMGLRIGALLLLIIAGVLFAIGRQLSKGPHQAARQAVRMLRPADWAMALGFGIVLPVVAHWVLVQYTPLGGRNFGASYFAFTYPALPLISLLAFILLATAYVLRCGLLKRLPFRDDPRAAWWLEKSAMLVVLLVPLLAFLLLQVMYENNWWRLNEGSCYLLMALPALALVAEAALGLWKARKHRPAQRLLVASTCLSTAHCIPVAIIACLLSSTAFRMSEIHWIRQERTLRLNADKPDLGIYEMMVARQAYKEINAIVFPDE